MYSDKADVWGCKKEESDEQKWEEEFEKVWEEHGDTIFMLRHSWMKSLVLWYWIESRRRLNDK